jgi:hypothetical protein
MVSTGTRRPAGSDRRRPPSPGELHRAWLELVETDGPFLAIPPLKRVWPQGMPALPTDRLDILREGRPAFDTAWEKLDAEPDDEAARDVYRFARDEWVRTVLQDVVGWQESLIWSAPPAIAAHSPDWRVTVAPDAALVGADGPAALVSLVDKCDSLTDAGTDGWAATSIDRMEAMLRGAKVPVGVVTDGRWWALVSAQPDLMVASGIIDAQTWIEEPLTRNAFFTVLSRQYIIGGDPAERLPVLFTDSVAAAEEITEALGSQVRRAVELLIQAFAETAAEARRRGLADPLPADPREAYDAAVTVMMRVVFLLFAEERALLPQGALFSQGYGISGELDALERRRLDDGDESLDSTYLTWHRLLATSQALHRGVSFEDMRMPAYGGSLFDPDRYGFLTAPNEHGTLALPVSDLVLLHVLRAVQVAQLRGDDARRISFGDIDVEQIGYIYEGLLGYTCARVAGGVQVGLVGAPGAEPEIPLATLEELAARHRTPTALANAMLAWVKVDQPAAKPSSATALAKLLGAGPTDDDDRQLRAATADDDALRERLRPFARALRRDLRDRPVVLLDGGLLVTETPSRRHAGAHYTPRALAEEVVQYALEPLCFHPGPHQTADSKSWTPRSSEEILGLKVADIAAGSGAFLVAAGRYLAGRLVEAWTREDPGNAHRPGLAQHAVREVVARCLYGADINAMAVEMCKLSLWLVSMDRNQPFSFVDDKILHGNSLLGLTDLKQLTALHIDPSAAQQMRLSSGDIEPVVRQVVGLRHELASEVLEDDPQRSSNAKRRQLTRVHKLTAPLRRIADGVIATGLALGGKPGKALNEAYEDLAEAVDGAEADPAFLESIMDEGLTPTVPTDYERWKPLHWVLEVPDVIVDHGGFDAIVGNPPFLGGHKLTGVMGTNLRDWLVCQLAGGTRGRADYVAYFFLRAFSLLRKPGILGLIATDSVAQVESREVGLEQMKRRGFEITRSIKSATWPSRSANLQYAAVWGTNDAVDKNASRVADGEEVERISTLLEEAGRIDSEPATLVENSGIAFQGSKLDAKGFVLTTYEAGSWLERDPELLAVLFPYLIGKDVNSRPDCSASRWVIDFADRDQQQAARYAIPFARVESTVRYERLENNRKALRERWWQHSEKRPALRRAISGLDEVLVITLHEKTLMPMRVKTGFVYSHALAVISTQSYVDQSVLSSSMHQVWAIKYGSGIRMDPRYTPSVVFETFPRPQPTGLLSEIGATLDRERREIMLRRQLGLTKLYNLVNDPRLVDTGDPDVARLRQIHVEVDEAVMAAYGWDDVPLDHGFHTYRQMTRWSVSPVARVEILDRLLEENLRRAAEQQPKSGKARKARARTAAGGSQGMLL